MQFQENYVAAVEAKIEKYQKEAELHSLSQHVSKTSLRKSLANIMRHLADKLEPSPQTTINERML